MTNVTPPAQAHHGRRPAGRLALKPSLLPYPTLMLVATPPRLPPAAVAVLLVLLPLAAGVAQPGRAGTRAMLDKLQHRLGTAIQVLVVDEENDPDVVRSFRVPVLPAFLLVRQGIELWRQPGLPDGELIAEQLLQRVRRPSGQAAPSNRA